MGFALVPKLVTSYSIMAIILLKSGYLAASYVTVGKVRPIM